MKKVAILQSNYIPWKGYFDIINSVDEFILYDDMQYTRRDWRNRNKILTPQGVKWLTIPVNVKGKFYQPIRETTVVDHQWVAKHWRSIEENYAHAPSFEQYRDRIHAMYRACLDATYLSKINYIFLHGICDLLGIRTKLSWSSDYDLVDGKTERLVALVKDTGGSYYLSGPAAQDYIVSELFEEAGIELAWMDYSGYPEYPQQHHQPFTHGVSILDLLFNTGEHAREYMKSFGKGQTA